MRSELFVFHWCRNEICIGGQQSHKSCTVQDDLLAREIFGEFVSEIQLADFILAILL